MNLELFDVVRVPFPFSDSFLSKKRPALVLSSCQNYNRCHVVMAMITSAKHSNFPLDVLIQDSDKAGLPKSCLVRMKLFTIDSKLIDKKIGRLCINDQKKVIISLKKLMPILFGNPLEI